MIETEGLFKSFKGHVVLKGLDLNVHAGEVYGFLGLNGSGKTTTMNILTGISGYDSGNVIVSGVKLTPNNKRHIPGLAYLPENPALYPFMTGREYLDFTVNFSKLTQSRAKSRVEAMLELSGLKSAAKRKIGGYSRGMRQRLGLAAALLNGPKVIFLDEPTSALDPEGRQDILDIITNLKAKGCTVFLSTHLLDDAQRVCDRIGILKDGKVILNDTLVNLRKKHLLPIVDIVFGRQPQSEEIAFLRSVPQIRKIQFEGVNATAYMTEENAADGLFAALGRLPLSVQSFQRRSSNLQEIFLETSKEASV